MKSLYLPLALTGELSVRLFHAEVRNSVSGKGYTISFSVGEKIFDSETPSYSTTKHRVFEDFNKRYDYPVQRRCRKAEIEADGILNMHLYAHLVEACAHYGVPVPKVEDATESFAFPVFEAYKYQVLGLDEETQQIIQGFEEALEFCKDFDPEEGQNVDDVKYPFATTYKIAQLVKHFCTRLQKDEKWDVLLDTQIDLNRIGNCLYYGVKGHGVGFFDESVLKDDKPLVEYLDSVMQELYLDVFLNEGLIVVDASINKQVVKA